LKSRSFWGSAYAGYLKIMVAATTWGTLGLIVRSLPLASETIVFYRVLFSVLAILPFLFATGRVGVLRVTKHRLLLLVSGIVLALNWVFFFRALNLTTIANAVLITYTYPIMVAVFAPFFLDERLELATLVSLILSVVGMVLVVSPASLSLGRQDILGIVYAFLSAVTYAFLVIASKRMLPHMTSYAIIFYEALVVAIVLLPFGLQRPFAVSPMNWILLATMGIVHTTAAHYLYYSGLSVVKAQHASVLTYVEPVSAVIFAALFLKEIPQVLTTVGGILIVLAGFIVVRRHARTGLVAPD
jgi:drug/metabolite transporter (DMT)-like permease